MKKLLKGFSFYLLFVFLLCPFHILQQIPHVVSHLLYVVHLLRVKFVTLVYLNLSFLTLL